MPSLGHLRLDGKVGVWSKHFRSEVNQLNLLVRLEDVKLSISFQNLPAAKELNISGTKDSFQNLSGPRELNLPGARELNLPGVRELNLSSSRELNLSSGRELNMSGPGVNMSGPGVNMSGPGVNISGPGVNMSGPPGDIALASPQQVKFNFKQT